MNEWIEVAAKTVALLAPLAPYLKKAGESIAGEVGKDALKKAREVTDRIRQRFQGDNNQKALTVFDLFLDDPNDKDQANALSKQIVNALQQHQTWAEEMRQLLAEPALQEVIARNQSIAKDITLNLSGSGTQRVELDNSEATGITMTKK